MKKKTHQFLILFLFTALLTACSLPARATSTPIIDQALAGTIVAMTLQAIHTRTPENSPAAPLASPVQIESTVINSPVPSTTPSPQATITATGTITPTFSAPQLSFDSTTNCREGPGTNFKVVTVLNPGQHVEPIGVQANYWVVNSPKGVCWVITDFATPSGSTWSLPTVTAPASPSLQAPPAPAWSKWTYNCNYASSNVTITTNLSWSDLSSNLTGYRVYRDGQVIATLTADVTSYADTTPWQNGKTLTYYIEAYKDATTASGSSITASCQ